MPAPVNSEVIGFGVYEFNVVTRELRKNGMRLRLEGQPLTILEMLLKRPGELVTREELQNKLWPGDTFVDFEHSLNAGVKRLRAILSDSSEHPRYIETQARRGYRFIAPLDSGRPCPSTCQRPACISGEGASGPYCPELVGHRGDRIVHRRPSRLGLAPLAESPYRCTYPGDSITGRPSGWRTSAEIHRKSILPTA